VTRHEIDYRGNVNEGETVTGETWVPDPPRGARFDRYVRFTGADGRVKVEAKSTWAMLDRATGRLLRVREDVAAPFLEGALVAASTHFVTPAKAGAQLLSHRQIRPAH
jgi:acyl-CoA thioester hydrolase